jgi:membrane protein
MNIIYFIMRKMRDPYYAGAPAELAFFFLLSMVPLTIVLGELLGLFSISINWIFAIVEKYASFEVAEALTPYLNYQPSGTVNFAFLALALWASSRGQYSLIRISNYAYEHGGISFSYIHERFRAIKTVVLTLFLIAFSLVILIYGESILKVIAIYFNQTFDLEFTVRKIWLVARWPIAIAVYFLTISYTYAILPAEKLKIKAVIPGALFSSAFILISSLIYSKYLAGFTGKYVLYGSLATIVVLLFWFYMVGFILVIGIQLNIAWRDVKE